MPQIDPELSTGLAGLDRLFTGLIPGDNIVWQVASLEDYAPFAESFRSFALSRGIPLLYFRFARHPPLLTPEANVEIVELKPEDGFENFLWGIHRTIERNGHGGYYLFDMLSDLAAGWYSDQMLGNFFMLTCPYLYDVGAIAYFGLQQGYHSPDALDPISRTAQVLVDVFRYRGRLYLHPNKVQQRYSSTMHMLHVRQGDDFLPVAESATISEVMTGSSGAGRFGTAPARGVVQRIYARAEASLQAAAGGEELRPAEEQELLAELLRTCFTRDARVLALLTRYLHLADAVAVQRRMIGTGLIGGKSVGMILARAILREKSQATSAMLESHDSFYIGSDVYYSFVVHNGLWWMRERQQNLADFLDRARRARQRMLVGTFPEATVARLAAMMDYYGQSPIVIRSSSLLEDTFGNAFAGKYESVFCPNQGPRHQRLEDLLTAVRTIYASTMSENALNYRARRGLLERDEQMALLVQRVSGVKYGDLFFPQVAGVGLSYNPYVWNSAIDPRSGVVRLVFGLGTRAVDRHDEDYTRVVALNAPERRPESELDDVRRYAQRRVDVIDLDANQLLSCEFESVVQRGAGLPLDWFVSRDPALERRLRELGQHRSVPPVLTFDKFLHKSGFVPHMSGILRTLEEAYGSPVDVEFAANFTGGEEFRINLVQCRPLQVVDMGGRVELPAVRGEDLLFAAHGALIGHSRKLAVDRIIYVVPSAYAALPMQQRYAVAHLVGRLAHTEAAGGARRILLIGPGRWGSTSPALGVPVKFHDISPVSVLCEVVAMHDGLIPDVSLGTHFFNDIVESDMLYLALFPGKEGNILEHSFFEGRTNGLTDLFPEERLMAEVVRLLRPAPDEELRFAADTHSQRALCFRQTSGPQAGSLAGGQV